MLGAGTETGDESSHGGETLSEDEQKYLEFAYTHWPTHVAHVRCF